MVWESVSPPTPLFVSAHLLHGKKVTERNNPRKPPLQKADLDKQFALFIGFIFLFLPCLWGTGCLMDHRKMSRFSENVDVILKSRPQDLTRAKVKDLMDGVGSKAEFELQPAFREMLVGESGNRAIHPSDGEAFCQSSALDPGIIPQCIHIAYDKSDRVLWTYAVLVD